MHVNAAALSSRLRPAQAYAEAKALVRQTANYPIATMSSGLAFRNTCLAVFGHPHWDPHGVVALLNSALIRWVHYHRFRDARQSRQPQVKIGHLRAIPTPPTGFGTKWPELVRLGQHLSGAPDDVSAREALDSLTAYRLPKAVR